MRRARRRRRPAGDGGLRGRRTSPSGVGSFRVVQCSHALPLGQQQAPAGTRGDSRRPAGGLTLTACVCVCFSRLDSLCSCWLERRRLQVGLAVERCGEGQVVEGAGHSVGSAVGRHPLDAVLGLVGRQLAAQLLRQNVGLVGRQDTERVDHLTARPDPSATSRYQDRDTSGRAARAGGFCTTSIVLNTVNQHFAFTSRYFNRNTLAQIRP